MMPEHFLNRSVFIRELMPQDLKLEIDRLTRGECGRFLAAVVGTAHSRQMDTATRARWHRVLNGHRLKRLDLPRGFGQALLISW
jgi:hypothetical protein